MSQFFSAIVYAALHRRIACNHCGSYDHHKRIDHLHFRCNSCRREFTVTPK
ncbi:hypothetical protein L4X63_02345 [Geomonas sp. Red32]|uniref:hypothetical protein n=1 Tax=Geomonas sp. Red32 TaxID=2912856 RepID=UPI00202CAC25|nr:hypothetical protein [Geomonas sp. Red32]MCM0080420.1 hypothetical protein [Geomonas sp. Red32]